MNESNHKALGYWYYTFFLVSMMWRYFDGLLLSQLTHNPILSPRIDPMVWIYQTTGLQYLITNSIISIFFDLLLVIIPFVCLYRLYKGRCIRVLSLSHFTLLFLYIITIYCFPTLSIRKYLGILFMPLIFVFKNQNRRFYTQEILRYYVAFIFVSASLWKIARGSIWNKEHMINVLKAQHIDSWVHFPDHFISKSAHFLIENPLWCHVTFILAVVTQLSFVVAFLTKKYDMALGALLVVFILGDYLVMRIEYWEFIVFLPLFWTFITTFKTEKSHSTFQ